VTHPDAKGLIMSERWGNIRTEVGPAGYVLNTGDKVVISPEFGRWVDVPYGPGERVEA
jgi:hypothetical protein